jgi:glycosyltransferase involved in cell wall biosynthesis
VCAGVIPCDYVSPGQRAPVCLAVPADTSRFLAVIPRLSRSWPGSISAALLSLEPLALAEPNFSRAALERAGACAPDRMSIALAEGHQFVKPPKIRFPHNLLRNLAVAACRDPYLIMLDGDLEIFPPLSAALLNSTVRRMLTGNQASKLALVLPSFSVRGDVLEQWEARNVREAPFASKQGLHELVDRGLAKPFNSIIFPPGVAATDYERWFKASAISYPIKPNYGYEPYVLVRTEVARSVLYDTIFAGFGLDKISHIQELRAAGFEFRVLRDLYVVHTHRHAQVNQDNEQRLIRIREEEESLSPTSTNALVNGLTPGSAVGRVETAAAEKCTRSEQEFKRAYLGESCVDRFYLRLYRSYRFRVRAATSRACGLAAAPIRVCAVAGRAHAVTLLVRRLPQPRFLLTDSPSVALARPNPSGACVAPRCTLRSNLTSFIITRF